MYSFSPDRENYVLGRDAVLEMGYYHCAAVRGMQHVEATGLITVVTLFVWCQSTFEVEGSSYVDKVTTSVLSIMESGLWRLEPGIPDYKWPPVCRTNDWPAKYGTNSYVIDKSQSLREIS